VQKRLPLVLSAKAATFRAQDANAESADAEFHHVRPKVLQRDDNACRFCGFRDKGAYIQVHHRDDDHGNNRMDNLVTACIHCHAVHHIGLWGVWDEAVLIYLPEIEQWQLSHICRSILVARHYPSQLANSGDVGKDQVESAKRFKNAADITMGKLMERTKMAEDVLGTSSPRVLGNVMPAIPDQLYEGRHQLLGGIRLLLTGQHKRGQGGIDQFETIALGWMDRKKQGVFAGLMPNVWSDLASSSKPRHA
jgi:intracellular multiplication protein IcmJ